MNLELDRKRRVRQRDLKVALVLLAVIATSTSLAIEPVQDFSQRAMLMYCSWSPHPSFCPDKTIAEEMEAVYDRIELIDKTSAAQTQDRHVDQSE
jgi:hypothetical protein